MDGTSSIPDMTTTPIDMKWENLERRAKLSFSSSLLFGGLEPYYSLFCFRLF
jgi:hypothetical protein